MINQRSFAIQQSTNATRAALHLGLRSAAMVRLTVIGTSMWPLVGPGDVVYMIQVDPAKICCGDVLVLWHEHGPLTHRVVKLTDSSYLTKGDNCRTFDPATDSYELLGRVIGVIRGKRRIDLQQQRWYWYGKACAWISSGEGMFYATAHHIWPRQPQILHKLSLIWALPLRLLLHALVLCLIYITPQESPRS